MQLDPYEQQLDLPARARQVGGRDGGNLAVIGQAIERCSRFDVAELDAPHGMRIVDGRGPAGPLDGWVAGQPEDLATGRAQRRWNCGLDSARMTKKACLDLQGKQALVIRAAMVHDVRGPGSGVSRCKAFPSCSLPSEMRMKVETLPCRSSKACSFAAPLMERNLAQGQTERQGSMVEASKAQTVLSRSQPRSSLADGRCRSESGRSRRRCGSPGPCGR